MQGESDPVSRIVTSGRLQFMKRMLVSHGADMITLETQTIFYHSAQLPIISFCVNPTSRLRRFFPRIEGYVDFDFILANPQHPLAMKFLLPGLECDVVNP